MNCVPLNVEPVADMNGPASEMMAAVAAVPKGLLVEINVSIRSKGVVVPEMSVPPVFTVLFVRLISGLDVVLPKAERVTERRLNSGVIVVLVAERSGPARLTAAGATSSDDGKPVTVSVRKKKLAPDCASEIVTVEPERLIR